eukprot:gene22997-29183_t
MYEEASAVLVVYSVANRDSLQSCSRWYNGVRAIRSNVNLIGALVGNKAEYRDGSLDSRAEVTVEEATAMAGSIGVPYFETSAANNLGVEDTFRYFAEEFHKRYEENVNNGGNGGGDRESGGRSFK